MKNILIIGHGRHGKDTVAEMMRDLFGFTFESSSMAAARIFLYDLLKDKYGYKNFEECYEDRANHRDEWYNAICDYNKNDKAALAKEILKDSNIYVGMRDNVECDECLRQGIFDLVIGVFNPRKPLEPKSSFNIDMWKKSHILLPNSGSLSALKKRVKMLKPLVVPQPLALTGDELEDLNVNLEAIISKSNKIRYVVGKKRKYLLTPATS